MPIPQACKAASSVVNDAYKNGYIYAQQYLESVFTDKSWKQNVGMSVAPKCLSPSLAKQCKA